MGANLTRNRERSYASVLHTVLITRHRYICCICDVKFDSKVDLDNHMQEVHANASYTCNYCNLVCETWTSFQEHIYLIHRGILFCTYCYEAHSNYSSLLEHWKTHEPFKCEICNDTFVTLEELREHNGLLHGETTSRRPLSFFQRFRRQRRR